MATLKKGTGLSRRNRRTLSAQSNGVVISCWFHHVFHLRIPRLTISPVCHSLEEYFIPAWVCRPHKFPLTSSVMFSSYVSCSRTRADVAPNKSSSFGNLSFNRTRSSWLTASKFNGNVKWVLINSYRTFTLPVVNFYFLLDCFPIETKSLHQSVSVNRISSQVFHKLFFVGHLFLDDALLVILKVPN